jgi:hypothetical protein
MGQYLLAMLLIVSLSLVVVDLGALSKRML